MHLPSDVQRSSGVHSKLEAAILLKGVVRISLAGEKIEVQPRTWYSEGGTRYLELRRRDSGETMKVALDDILEVTAY